MWDLIVSVPDHCLSFYFTRKTRASGTLNSARIGTFVLSMSAFTVGQTVNRLLTCDFPGSLSNFAQVRSK